MLSLVLVFALADSDPKTIVTVKSSLVCTSLRQNIAQTVQGLMANDQIADTGGELLAQSGKLAAAAPLAAGATGGHSPGAQLDTMRELAVVDQLVKNLEKIDALLSDPHAFPAVARTDAEKALLHERDALQAVADYQRSELNILSMDANTNAATDLNARSALITVDGAFVQAKPPPHVSDFAWFAQEQAQTKAAETAVAAGVQPLVDACR